MKTPTDVCFLYDKKNKVALQTEYSLIAEISTFGLTNGRGISFSNI